MKIKLPVIDCESHLPGLQVMDLNALVPVRIEAPILGANAVPKTNAVQPWQDIAGNWHARIMALGQGGHFDFSATNRQGLWLAGIDAKAGPSLR
jgi:hypothetical protein